MKHLFTLIICLSSISIYAQGLKISNAVGNPDSSAMLDVESTSQGVLIPRMTSVQRDSIQNPADGLQIFNTTTGCLNVFVQTGWRQICPECEFSPPQASVSSPACEGGSTQLMADSIPGASYLWSGPNGFSSTQRNPSLVGLVPASAGAYTVSATVSGCTRQGGTASLSILNSPTTANAGLDITISGSDTIFWNDFNSPPVSNVVLDGDASFNAGTLQLTPDQNGQYGSAYVTDASTVMSQIGASRNNYSMHFDMYHGGGSGADGHEMVFGDSSSIVPSLISGGVSNGLRVRFCSYSASYCNRVQIFYNNASIGNSAGFPWRNSTVPVQINVDTNGLVQVIVNGGLKVQGTLPGSYLTTDKSSWTIGSNGFTGGLDDFHRVDDLAFFSEPFTRSVTLNANTPTYGSGSWSVISGSGGSFSSTTDPNATFSGRTGESYQLQWTISNSCGSSSDQVNINF